MASTTETEALDTQRTSRLEAADGQDSSHQQGTDRQEGQQGQQGKGYVSRRILFHFGASICRSSGWWLNFLKYESTDDAQIEGHLDLVSPRISGTVIYINPRVENNQFVEAGTLLLELDPRDYQAELEHAKANLDTMRDSRGSSVPRSA